MLKRPKRLDRVGGTAGLLRVREVMNKVVEPLADPSYVRVKEVMSSPLFTVLEDMPVEEAARLMAKKRIKEVKGVSRLRVLLGEVTITTKMATAWKNIQR